jgi:hypothetical protein
LVRSGGGANTIESVAYYCQSNLYIEKVLINPILPGF